MQPQESQPPTLPVATPGLENTSQAMQAQPVEVNVSNKSYVVAWILSLLLGYFGVDRFYLGRFGTGILKLITLGGLGIWALIDWILITFGVTKDKSSRALSGYNENKKTIQAISVLILIVGISVGAWQSFHNNPNINTKSSQQNIHNNGLVSEKLETARLSFEYPISWRVMAQSVGKTQDGQPTQFFELESPDNFQLGIQIADSSFFPNDSNTSNNTRDVKEVLSTNSVGTAVVLSNGDANKPYSGVTIAGGVRKVGDAISTANKDLPTNPAMPGLYISINGGYVTGFSTLTEFNNQPSVKQAVQIFQSLKYY